MFTDNTIYRYSEELAIKSDPKAERMFESLVENGDIVLRDTESIINKVNPEDIAAEEVAKPKGLLRFLPESSTLKIEKIKAKRDVALEVKDLYSRYYGKPGIPVEALHSYVYNLIDSNHSIYDVTKHLSIEIQNTIHMPYDILVLNKIF